MAYQILMVDDDADFRQELKDCLVDYEVIEASDGQEALDILKKPNAVDLVILDAVMPQLSGLEVLREIKRLKPSLSIIMLTGQSSKDMAIDALKGRADDYVEKPIKVGEFLETVRTNLSTQAAPGPRPAGGIQSKIHQAKQFMERNFDKKVTLHDVAGLVCLSPKYFSRVFKEVDGQGFNDFRLSLKTRHACAYLRQSQKTVTEIASRLGYENLESFIRMFERTMKQSPTQYRRRHQK